MVAIAEILREQFEVQSGGILSTGGEALGYNVIDTRYDTTDTRHLVRTFDNAQAAQNYSNEINARLRSNPDFDPRASSTPGNLQADPEDRIGRDRRVNPPDQETPRAVVGQMDPDDLFTTNDLTRAQRAELRQNGKIVIGGIQYTRDDITAMERRITTRASNISREQGLRDTLTPDRDDLSNSVSRSRSWLRRNMISRPTRLFAGSLAGLGANIAIYTELYRMLDEQAADLQRRLPNLDDAGKNAAREEYIRVQRNVLATWMATSFAQATMALLTNTSVVQKLVDKILDGSNRIRIPRTRRGALVSLIQTIGREAFYNQLISAILQQEPVREWVMSNIVKSAAIDSLSQFGVGTSRAVGQLVEENWPFDSTLSFDEFTAIFTSDADRRPTTTVGADGEPEPAANISVDDVTPNQLWTPGN